MSKFHGRYVINSNDSIGQMAKRLGSFPKFKEKMQSENRGVFTVGSKLKLAMMGTMSNNDYVAPVKIELERHGTETTVEISQNYPLPFYRVSSMVEFYEKTAADITAALTRS